MHNRAYKAMQKGVNKERAELRRQQALLLSRKFEFEIEMEQRRRNESSLSVFIFFAALLVCAMIWALR